MLLLVCFVPNSEIRGFHLYYSVCLLLLCFPVLEFVDTPQSSPLYSLLETKKNPYILADRKKYYKVCDELYVSNNCKP